MLSTKLKTIGGLNVYLVHKNTKELIWTVSSINGNKYR